MFSFLKDVCGSFFGIARWSILNSDEVSLIILSRTDGLVYSLNMDSVTANTNKKVVFYLSLNLIIENLYSRQTRSSTQCLIIFWFTSTKLTNVDTTLVNVFSNFLICDINTHFRINHFSICTKSLDMG